jgi:type IV pilus assembly protein PilF
LLLALALSLLAGCTTITTGNTQTPQEQETSTIEEAADINLKLGVGYMQAGRFDIARAKLNKALDYDPNLAEAHNALGVLYESTGASLQAEQHYRQAIERDSSYTLARMNYGRLLCAAGSDKAAEGEQQFLTAATDADNADPANAYTGAGVCARARNDLVKADVYFRQALQANPYSAGTLLELAALSYDRSQYDQAREFLQRYHKQAGYNPASLNLAIKIEEELGDTQQRDEYSLILQTQFANS